MDALPEGSNVDKLLFEQIFFNQGYLFTVSLLEAVFSATICMILVKLLIISIFNMVVMQSIFIKVFLSSSFVK